MIVGQACDETSEASAELSRVVANLSYRFTPYQQRTRKKFTTFQIFVEMWHAGLQDPARTQAQTLEWLLEGYAQTIYGQQHGAADLLTLSDDPPRFFQAYRRAFPVVTYDTIKPWIDRVVAGQVEALLPEPPIAWAMTRGTTRGVSKRIPITEPDLGIRVAAARGLLQHLLRTNQLDALRGYSLNLNYPSVVGAMDVAGKETSYGYSSGIYVLHAAAAPPVEILPTQEDIDALGGGDTPGDWERRFEMIYQKTKDAPITTPTSSSGPWEPGS